MSITTVTTLNSIYEIDQDRSQVRRTAGLRQPTRNQPHYIDDENGWAPHIAVAWVRKRLIFVWEVDGTTWVR